MMPDFPRVRGKTRSLGAIVENLPIPTVGTVPAAPYTCPVGRIRATLRSDQERPGTKDAGAV